MRRRRSIPGPSRAVATLVGAVSLLVLAGCPLPQALPEYSAGSITPPRIVVDELLGDDGVVFVPEGCPTAPSYVLSAHVVDTNTIEAIEARWFVNYDFRETRYNVAWQPRTIQPNADTTNLTRAIPPFTFEPYQHPPPFGVPYSGGTRYDADGILHVVELVVSNGFDPAFDNTIAPRANRSPKPGFETQFHRWVFLNVPATSSVPCPTP
jgi:hypothetical protein